jgi:ferrochelatase
VGARLFLFFFAGAPARPLPPPPLPPRVSPHPPPPSPRVARARQAAAGGFRAYTAFRYAPPLTDAALRAMAADGVERAVAFSQYPQFSCTTAGSSLNHLWRESVRLGLERTFSWSVLDRWPTHPTFVAAVARCVATGLARFPEAQRDRVVILFSAHSLPMKVVERGDAYVAEVAATVDAVMGALRRGGVAPAGEGGGPDGAPLPPVRATHTLAWQSKVGFLPWMAPKTGDVLAGLARQGFDAVLAVPIAFTSDHVETLYEIDVEYAHAAREAGIARFERAPSLNGEPLLALAQAQLVEAHLRSGEAAATPAYALNCHGCTNPTCRTILNPAAPYEKLRDGFCAAAGATPAAAGKGGKRGAPVPPWPCAGDLDALRARGSTPCD